MLLVMFQKYLCEQPVPWYLNIKFVLQQNLCDLINKKLNYVY